jgi:hypothetical protein
MLFYFLITLLPMPSTAQQLTADTVITDTTAVKVKKHSPTKATIMSACVPGLGQIYNRKWWKVPVIYTGFGIMTYFIVTNTNYYIDYKCAYIESTNGNTNGNYKELVNRYTSDELLSAREYYRRNLEVSCLITAVWYILNILDATVDAHLYSFNVSEDLTLRMEPAFQVSGLSSRPAPGLKLSIRF